jgi:hypothetical protein
MDIMFDSWFTYFSKKSLRLTVGIMKAAKDIWFQLEGGGVARFDVVAAWRSATQ